MRAIFIVLILSGCAGTQVRQTYSADVSENPTLSIKIEIEKKF